MKATRQQGPACFIQAWVCLLAYLFGATPLPALSAAAAAELGGEHQLALASDAGHIRVVLKHDDSGNPAGCLRHHHGPLCRAMLVLASAGTTPEADHVLDFGVCREALSAWDDAKSLKPPEAACAVSPELPKLPALVIAAHRDSSVPPVPIGIVVSRTTVLLI